MKVLISIFTVMLTTIILVNGTKTGILHWVKLFNVILRIIKEKTLSCQNIFNNKITNYMIIN